jgi:hypothetical protein
MGVNIYFYTFYTIAPPFFCDKLNFIYICDDNHFFPLKYYRNENKINCSSDGSVILSLCVTGADQV